MHTSCRPRALALAIAALLVAGFGAALEPRTHRSTVVTAAATGAAVVVPDPTVPPPTDAALPPAVALPVAPAVAPTTAAPAPVPPPTTVAPAPPAPAPPPPAPGPIGAQQRAEAAFVEGVPGAWRDALPVTIEIIEGSTSWASSTMQLRIGRYHAEGRWSHLVSVIGHEFGHIIAFVHGSRAFDGAAPEGWPDPNHGPPAEAWADCVSEVFTGIVDPSYGMPPCPQPSLQWTANWLAAGPP